MSGKFKN